MTPIKYIRKRIFAMTQAQFADVSGTSQASVSHWERDLRQPSIDELRRIRDAAKGAGHKWNDSWFFDLPEGADVISEAAE